jgi:hypothetical protein
MNLSKEYVGEALAKFEEVNAFRNAEKLCETLVLPVAGYLDENDVGRIVQAFVTNKQIRNAGGIPDLFLRLFQQTETISGPSRARLRRRRWNEKAGLVPAARGFAMLPRAAAS